MVHGPNAHAFPPAGLLCRYGLERLTSIVGRDNDTVPYTIGTQKSRDPIHCGRMAYSLHVAAAFIEGNS